MLHEMMLREQPFRKIVSGYKTIELRLLDEKRQKLKEGDQIRFINQDAPRESICVSVKKLHAFSDFAELYRALPLERCGYLPEELPTASPEDMNAYYSVQRQAQYGVLGIEIERIGCGRETDERQSEG